MESKKNLSRQEMFSVFIDSINYETEGKKKAVSNLKYINILFEIFGIQAVNNSTSKNWFGTGTTKNAGFTNYFNQKITHIQLEKCLNYFQKKIGTNIDIIKNNLNAHKEDLTKIDIETTDENYFFCSLIEQFLFIVKPSMSNDEQFELEEFIQKAKTGSYSQNPSKQMCCIFCDAIIKYKIAYYINNISDLFESCYYMETETSPSPYKDYDNSVKTLLEYYHSKEEISSTRIINFNPEPKGITKSFSTNVKEFLQYIYSEIITPYIPYQDETAYLLINEFCEVLHSYYHFFQMLRSDIARECFSLYNQNQSTADLSSKCQQALNKIRNQIIEIQKIQNTEIIKANNDSLYNLKSCESQLEILSGILSNHTQMCLLFSELADGKSLLVHTKA